MPVPTYEDTMMDLTSAEGIPESAVTSLLQQLPEWNAKLSKLNETMDHRHMEQRAAEKLEGPPNASLKRIGSMESLRPNDDPGLGYTGEDSDVDMLDCSQMNRGNTILPPRLLRNSTAPGQLRNDSHRGAPATGISKRDSPPVLRKRKPSSISSECSVAESVRSKRKKKSMIDVFYEGRIQRAFNDLHTSIAAARNSLRKGKMSKKYAAENPSAIRSSVMDRHRHFMKALSAPATTDSDAELGDLDAGMDLELHDNPDVLEPDVVPGAKTNGTSTPALDVDDLLPDLEPDTSTARTNGTIAPALEVLEADDTIALQPDASLPPLQYRSTRKMNPNLATTPYTRRLLAEQAGSKPAFAPPHSGIPFTRALSKGGAADVFDELDADLNSVSQLCGEAAHEYLRHGCCRLEIEEMEMILVTVKERAEKGLAENPELAVPASAAQQRPAGSFAALGMLDGLGDLDVDDGLRDLDADFEVDSLLGADDGMDGLGELEVDDGPGDLEVDDGLGDLEVDSTHRVDSVHEVTKSQRLTSSMTKSESVRASTEKFITVIQRDSNMHCSNGRLAADTDVASLSMKSADEAVTPDEQETENRPNISELGNGDVMAKYRDGRNAQLMGMKVEVHEVQITAPTRG